MVQGSQVKAGTELYATTEANVFKSAGSWKVVDVLRKGQIMEAAGSPVLVEGYKMLPIRPAGAVYLDETAIWLSDSDSGTSEDLAGSESVEDCSSKVPSSANPEEEQALAALLNFVANQGGNVNSSKIGSFYDEYPSHKTVIGKFRTFCNTHSHALQYKDIGNGNFILSSSSASEDDPTSSTTSGEDSGSDRQCIPPHEKALQVVASLRDLSKASRRRVETAASRILAAFPAHARLHCTKGPKNLGIYRAHLCPRGRRCEWGMRCTFAHNSQELLQVSPVRRLEIAITTMRSLCKTVPQ